MKNLLLTIVLFFSVSFAYSQWTYERIDNGFDEPYRIAYTKLNNNCILKLENVYGEIAFYIQGGYFCDDEPLVEMSFLVGSEYHKFYVYGNTSDDKNVIFIMDGINGSNILADFKNCSLMKIRITDDICDDEIYNFNMSHSTSAYNYILNQ